MIKNNLIEAIVKHVFRAVINWVPPKFIDSPSPQTNIHFEAFDQKRSFNMTVLRSALDSLSFDELQVLFNYLKEDQLPTSPDLKQEILSIIRDNRTLKPPLWFVGGFGCEKHKADYKYWSKMESFSLDEATCLTIGFEPKYVDKDLFTKIIKTNQSYKEIPEFFFMRREQIDRKFYLSYKNSRVSFQIFWAWIQLIDLEVPKEFLSSFQWIANRRKGQKKSVALENFDRREKTSLAQLLVVVAISEFGYNPLDTRSPVPKEMQDILAKLGLEISNDTIRKYLKLGASYLPDDWQT